MTSYVDDMPAELRAVRERVCKAMRDATPVHDAYVLRWNEAYSLYRNHRALEDHYRSSSDKATARKEVQRAWAANLCIPLIFSAIETITPRALSQNPTLTVKPRSPEAVTAAKAIKEFIEQQQRDINYEMKLQPTVKRGFKYGIGVQKTFFNREVSKVLRREERKLRPDKVVEREIVHYEGPDVEDVDIWDFFWDPAARDVASARWLIHRTWRDLSYIKNKIEQGIWFPSEDGSPLPDDERAALLQEIENTASSAAREEAWTERYAAQGLNGVTTRAGTDHEILEFHDREHVYTVINKTFVAQADRFPYWHREMPFQICVPTPQEGEFVGISEIEPVKHLQYELNTIRSQRLTNAAYILDRVYAYTEGMLDPEMVKRGPGALIPVVGDPSDVLFPIPVEDLPASSYREEDALKSDFDRATGISDPIAGAEAGSQETATGMQLVQAAANVRIAHKTKNILAGTLRPTARQFLEIDYQYLSEKRTVRIDDPEAQGGFRFAEIDPAIFGADVEVEPDAGSTEPENKVQERNDALTVFNQLNQNPNVDQGRLVRYLLTKHDVPDPETWIVPDPGQEVATALGIVANKLRETAPDEEKVLQFMDEVMQELQASNEQQQDPNQAQAQEPASEAPVPA